MRKKKMNVNRIGDSEDENFVVAECNSVKKGQRSYVYNSSLLYRIEERLNESDVEYHTIKVDDYWIVVPKYESKRGVPKVKKVQEEELEIFTLN